MRHLLAAACVLLLLGCGSSAPDPSAAQADRPPQPGGDARVEGGIPDEPFDPGVEGAGDLDAGIGADAAPSGDAGEPPADAGTSKGYELIAKEAARELKAMKSSSYEHTTFIDETKGIFNYDCSGFVGYALAQAVPDPWAALQKATVIRPLAKHFESYFAAIPSKGVDRWHVVVRAIDLVPGDIVAWLTPPAVSSSNTGHVAIVRATPETNAKDSGEVLVPITDATSSPHGPTDSRYSAGDTGLGTGTVGLLVDSGGAPWGYKWSGGYSTKSYSTSIALGHVD